MDGDETSLANTMMICSKHHRLLHEGEFTIHKDFEDKRYFRNNTGKIIPDAPGVKTFDYDDDEIDLETALAIFLTYHRSTLNNPPGPRLSVGRRNHRAPHIGCDPVLIRKSYPCIYRDDKPLLAGPASAA